MLDATTRVAPIILAGRSRAVLPPASTHAGGALLTPTAEVGTLADNFTVDDAGSVHDSIPLELRAGTNGVAPSLAFVYDSAPSCIACSATSSANSGSSKSWATEGRSDPANERQSSVRREAYMLKSSG
jgi:hypothetical protein